MADYTSRQGSLAPFPPSVLTDNNGDPDDLTTAVGLVFRAWPTGNEAAVFEMPVTILDAANGQVQVEPDAGDTDFLGVYEGMYVGTISGHEKSWPEAENLTWEIIDNGEVDVEDPTETLVFCTLAQAHALGRQFRGLSRDDLLSAQLVLTLATGVEAATDVDTPTQYDLLYDQDQAGLMKATAITALWLTEQPDFFTRISVKSEGANGETRTYSTSSVELPPLAQWALANTRFGAGAVGFTTDTPRDRSLVTSPVPYYMTERVWYPW